MSAQTTREFEKAQAQYIKAKEQLAKAQEQLREAEARYDDAHFRLRDEQKEEANQDHWLRSGWGRREIRGEGSSSRRNDPRLEYLIAFDHAAVAMKPEITRILGGSGPDLSTVARVPRRGVDDDDGRRDFGDVRVGTLSIARMALVEKHFQTQPISVVVDGVERDAWLPTKAKKGARARRNTAGRGSRR